MKSTSHSQHLLDRFNRLKPLVKELSAAHSEHDKLVVLNQDPLVNSYIDQSEPMQIFLAGLTPTCDVVIKSVLAIGQGPMVFQGVDTLESPYEKLRQLIEVLIPTEKFYAQMGGIVGYYAAVLRLIAEKQGVLPCKEESDMYVKPEGLDLTQPSDVVNRCIYEGIHALPHLAEIYPVGGAGDRLQLRDESTGELLPVAKLKLCGINLLEWLIRDIQAREYLYYKVTGKQTMTPIAMMTSHEKRNHERIIKICEERNWFGRPKDSFRFFTQPLVPLISEEGDWCLSAPLTLMLKPGGHGVMWKLAQVEGIFSWLQEMNRTNVLVRQINNPIAGQDIGLLAFTGRGFEQQKAFGFASCCRLLNAAEGMNVLCEKTVEDGYLSSITNIEYTDFSQKGIEDTPEEPGSAYSAFPANTNILFANLEEVQKALEVCPIPGTILNMKNDVECLNLHGNIHQVRAGRLESTMQNIADYITDFSHTPLQPAEQSSLKTFVTYNHRHRTISVTKKSHAEGQPVLETPEGCYYDIQRNAHELMTHACASQMPPLLRAEDFVAKGPTFFVHLHPALGPLYDIIAAKIHHNVLHTGAELTINAAEVNIQKIDLTGSLVIDALSPFGKTENACYSNRAGKCVLKNVTINNAGIDTSTRQKWWKGNIQRKEALIITLHGDAEFHAEDVTFNGSHEIEVPAGFRYVATQNGNGFALTKTQISKPSWHWNYSYAPSGSIQLKVVS